MDRTPSPGELLDPRLEVVPFCGRADELDALARWLDGDGTRSALLLHGPAGVGKTRLALHFAAGGGVHVVDDADLLSWRDLHHELDEPRTRRVLLTARTAGWWWSAARQRASGCTTAELEVTACPEEHAWSFADACAHFADALGRPRPVAAAPDAATFHDVHLAALAAVHEAPVDVVRRLIGADPDPPARGRLAEDVLAVALLDERIALDPSPHALETLLRAADRWPHVRHRAEELFTADPGLVATATTATLRALAELPVPARAVARRVFDDARFHGDPLPAVLTRTLVHDRAPTAGKRELVELLGALAARTALAGLREEAVEATRHEVALYRELAEQEPVEYRCALADALGDLGLRLVAVDRAEEALAACEEAVAVWRAVVADDEDCAPRLAAALDQVSRRYAALGRRADAMTAIGEAAERYRRLAAEHPALFGRDLARAVHQHAVRLFEAERHHEATEAAWLAVGHWRAVVEADPRHEVESGHALTRIASLLSAFGRPDDATAVLAQHT